MAGLGLELVSFDVDGTILKGRILSYLKIPKEYHNKIEALHGMFHQGRLGYEDTLRAQFSLLEGMKASEIMPSATALPLVTDLRTTIERLTLRRIRVAILTDNPSFLVSSLRIYGFQDVIATEIEIHDDLVTNRMKLLTNKLEALRCFCLKEGIEINRCAHVGDGFNDVIVFKGLRFSVAFNAQEEHVSRAATCSVTGSSLLDVYNVLEANLGK